MIALVFLAMIYVAIDEENIFLEVASYCLMSGAMTLIVGLSFYECFRDSSKKFINFN